MNHTAGPWYATTRQGSWDWVVARDAKNEICQMFHDGSELNETGEANARLIAAAPELLDALREMVEVMSFPRSHAARTGRTAEVVSLQAAAAIAKAEGRTLSDRKGAHDAEADSAKT